jgi:hypothetical protein
MRQRNEVRYVLSVFVSIAGTARDLRAIKFAENKALVQSDRIAAVALLKSDYPAHPRDLGMEHGAVSFVDTVIQQAMRCSALWRLDSAR